MSSRPEQRFFKVNHLVLLIVFLFCYRYKITGTLNILWLKIWKIKNFSKIFQLKLDFCESHYMLSILSKNDPRAFFSERAVCPWSPPSSGYTYTTETTSWSCGRPTTSEHWRSQGGHGGHALPSPSVHVYFMFKIWKGEGELGFTSPTTSHLMPPM